MKSIAFLMILALVVPDKGLSLGMALLAIVALIIILYEGVDFTE